MNIPILLNDLIKDFAQGRETNKQVIDLTDSLVAKIKTPLAYRFFQSSFSLVLEFLLWVAIIACFALIILMNKFYPFSLINEYKSIKIDGFIPEDLDTLTLVIRGLLLLLGLAFFWVARLLARGRKRAKVMTELTNELKAVMEKLLNRRSSIRDLSLKYPVDLSEDADSIGAQDSLPPGNEDPARDGHKDTLL